MNHETSDLAAYLANELSPKDRSRVETHLQACPACRAECERLKEIWDLLGVIADPSPSARSVWPAVRTRTTAAPPRMRLGAGWAAAALAAGVLVGAVLPGFGPLSGNGSTVSASGDYDSWLESSWLQTEQGDDLAAGWMLAGRAMSEDGS